MYLNPCRNCHKYKECDIYKAKLISLRGTGITSARFICKQFSDFYKPGDRVTALLSERFEFTEWDVDGTIIGVKDAPRGKLLLLLDKKPFGEPNEEGCTVNSRNKFIRLWPKHVKPNGESSVEVCKWCGIPRGKESESTFDCYDCNEIKKANQPQKLLPASTESDIELDW